MMNDNEKKLAGEIAERAFNTLMSDSDGLDPEAFKQRLCDALKVAAMEFDAERFGLLLAVGTAAVAFCQHRGGITFKFDEDK